MKIKWQWFLGGRTMFWVISALLVVLVFTFIMIYVIDPTVSVYMKVQNVDEISIKGISENYVNSLGVTINKPICYRFVKYRQNDNPKAETVLLGTFHEWNDCYYIDISVNLYHTSRSYEIVKHETRHMLIQELKNEKIIDLTKYTEEIAREENETYNNMFDCGIKLLKERNKEE